MVNEPDILLKLTRGLSSESWGLQRLSWGWNAHSCLVNLEEMLQISHRIISRRPCEIHQALCRHALKKPALMSVIQDREYKSI